MLPFFFILICSSTFLLSCGGNTPDENIIGSEYPENQSLIDSHHKILHREIKAAVDFNH